MIPTSTDQKTLVWLASYPKSGNTWLRAFLANYLTQTDEPVSFEDMQKISFGDSAVEPMMAIARKDPRKLAWPQLLQVREANLRRIASDGAELHFVKTHNAHARIGGNWLIPASLTRAAIYLVRNPLDVAVSYADHWGISPANAAQQMRSDQNVIPPNPRTVAQFLGNWSEHVKGWSRTKDFKVLTLRYEDLIHDPHAGFEKILRHIQVPIDRDVIAQAVAFSNFDTLAAQEAETGFSEKSSVQEKFFRKGAAGQWREALPSEVADRIVKDHDAMMRRFKYL